MFSLLGCAIMLHLYLGIVGHSIEGSLHVIDYATLLVL